jgi:hypothetical protein
MTGWMVWYRKIWPLAKRTAQSEQGFKFKVSKALSVVGRLKTKTGASSVSGGNTLEEIICLKIMRLEIRATNEM